MLEVGKTIAEDSPVYRFAAGRENAGEKELVALLTKQSETSLYPIVKISDVLLDSSGLIQAKYRLTNTALAQLCSILAPGLLHVVQNLIGERRRDQTFSGEAYSVEYAIDILNRMIRARSGLLEDRAQLVIDRRNNQIEGVVGPRYHFIGNLALYRQVRDQLANSGLPPTSFYEAALSGRRLQLRFRIRQPAFMLDTPDGRSEPFYGGLHYSNSELGNCCVKGSCVLIRQSSNTVSMAAYDKKSRVKHLRGGRFEQRFQDLFETTAARASKIPNLKSHMKRAKQVTLNLGDSPDKCLKRCAELEQILQGMGASASAAKDAVMRAVLFGSYRGQSVPGISPEGQGLGRLGPETMRTLSSRVVFDAYNALGALARKFSLDQQEAVEQAAYRVLTERNHF